MRFDNFFLLFLLLILSTPLLATQVKGTVKDADGQPLAYASVYVKNSSLGVSTDLKGRYIFEMEAGQHILVFGYLGYESLEQIIDLKERAVLTLDIVLKKRPAELGVVEVVVKNNKNLGKEIMAKVRAKRKFYLQQVKTYQCETYTKYSLDRKLIKPSVSDTMLLVVDEEGLSKRKKKKRKKQQEEVERNRAAFFEKDNLELVETVSELYHKSPNSFKEKIIANQDYSNKYNPNFKVTIYSDFGEIAPVAMKTTNPLLVYQVADPDFNFYKNTIDFPAVCSKPILSPLAFNAPLSYTYKLEGSFIEDGQKIYKIKVSPRFKSDALFKGLIFIQDSTFSIKSVDFEINPHAMLSCKEFKVLQNYELIEGKYSLPVRREILYTIKDGKENILGSASIRHKHYNINPELPKRFFNTETKIYAADAFEKDSLFWTGIRPITLKQEELKFIFKSDSIKSYHESPEYKRIQDSIFNHVSVLGVLLEGVSHRKNGWSIWLPSLAEQLNPFGVGGYRHRFPTSLQKEFGNNQILHLEGMIDYGVVNKDVKGSAGIGFTYLPKKFMRTFVRFGDSYGQINNYESVIGLFSRANYVRERMISAEQKMEIINGLFAELTLTLSEKIPIDSLDFKSDIFNELGTAVNFTPYRKAEIKLRLQYRPFQRFYYVHNKKVIVGSKWPTFFMEYKKGLKGVFGSEVDYDYLEFGASNYRKIGRWGYSNWAAKIGSFINTKSLRPFEHKFFRASDDFLFSNPLSSFQLLQIENTDATGKLTGTLKTLNTKKEFLQANYIHHFDGVILNKVPLVRYLKLELAAGIGTLAIRDLSFAHVEVFAGVERKVRIFRNLFRFGIYAVTADNTLEKAKFNFKIGASFYSDYSRKWNY